MQVVLDTNVLVSAIVFGGPPEAIVRLAAQTSVRLILSPAIFEEFRRVLREKFRFTDQAVYTAETLLRRVGIVVEPRESIELIADDPDDNRILEAAVAGKAEVIISGDRHLLHLGTFRGIPVVTMRGGRSLPRGARVRGGGCASLALPGGPASPS